MPTLSGTAVGGSRGVSAPVWTREAATGEVRVWMAQLDAAEWSYSGLRAILSAHEKARADRYRLERDRRRFVVRRAY